MEPLTATTAAVSIVQIIAFIIQIVIPIVMAGVTIYFLNRHKKNNPTDLAERVLKTEMNVETLTKDIKKVSDTNSDTLKTLTEHSIKLITLESSFATLHRDVAKLETTVIKEMTENKTLLQQILSIFTDHTKDHIK